MSAVKMLAGIMPDVKLPCSEIILIFSTEPGGTIDQSATRGGTYVAELFTDVLY
jgi:hypothetical protein